MSTVGYTVVVNVIIAGACVLFYSSYRMKDDQLYAPKADFMPGRTPPKLTNKTMFGWINELYSISDTVLIEKGSYDALFLIRFYRLTMKALLCFSIYAWGVLLPINRSGNGDSGNANSFEIWSMTNIQQGSDRCWYHLIGIYILTALIIYFLENEFVVYAKHRHIYLRQRHAHLRTVLVEGIPHKMRSTVTLATYFETLYPNAVQCVRLGQDLRFLERLVEQRQVAVAQLERCLYLEHTGYDRPTIRVGNMVEKVDAIRYYTQVLDDLNIAVAKEQETASRLAMYTDRMSGSDAINVIESFLQVTEIGSVRKMLKERSGSSSKWMINRHKISRNNVNNYNNNNNNSNYNNNDNNNTGNITMNNYQQSDLKLMSDSSTGYGATASSQDDEKYLTGLITPTSNGNNTSYADLDDSSPNSPMPSNSRTTFVVYKLTLKEWLWALWTAPTLTDCWRVVKEGRHAEDHDVIDCDEDMTLISPPEERRMFLSKAFVTFKTFTAATTARQVLHMQLAGHMAISEAPEATDMTWVNLYATRTGTFFRRLFVESAVMLLIVVWVAPVTLLSYVVSEDALRGFFPFIDTWCAQSEFFASAIELIQPTALVGIMNLLPPILSALATLEGCISFSANQFRSFDRYFTFQVINVFLVTTIAGSVIDCVKEIYEDPASTFELLGNSLPKMGGFFTNYIIMKAFMGLGMEIVRFPALFSALLKYLFTSNLTPRDRRAIPLFGSIRATTNPGWFPFAKIFAQDMLLAVLCATYACIAPLIVAPGICYFGLASFVYKHQLLYVYEPIYETGGKWWPKLARCFVVALLFAQSTMVGMMILKETYTEIYFLVLIIALTSGYYYYVQTTYVPLAAQLPFDMAVSMDLDEKKKCAEELAGAEHYVQPALREGVVLPDVEFSLKIKSDAVDV